MEKEGLKQLKNVYGIDVKRVEKTEGNEVFNQLSSKLEEYFNGSDLKLFVNYEVSEINTLVEIKRGFYTLKQHPCITLSISDGSHLRFSPDKKNGIEITRVFVAENMRKKGVGTTLVKIFHALCNGVLGELPNMTLECTGAIGIGDNQVHTPLNAQIKFFEQFGFKVKNKGKQSGYAKMEYFKLV